MVALSIEPTHLRRRELSMYCSSLQSVHRKDGWNTGGRARARQTASRICCPLANISESSLQDHAGILGKQQKGTPASSVFSTDVAKYILKASKSKRKIMGGLGKNSALTESLAVLRNQGYTGRKSSPVKDQRGLEGTCTYQTPHICRDEAGGAGRGPPAPLP